MNQPIEISLSKRKLVISLLGCLLFVIAGGFFVYTPETFARKTAFRTETMIIAVGVLSILFFGMCGYFIVKKLVSKVAALTINDKGIVDHSSALNGRFVPWEDVSEIGKVKVFRQSFVTIKLKNPEHYINQESNAAARKIMQANLRSTGTPFCISANALSISFRNLYALLEHTHKERLGAS